MKFISDLLGGLILFYIIIYTWSKLLNKKINYKNVKFYLIWIIFSITSIYNYFIVNKFVRISVLLVIMIIFCQILFNDNFKKTIMTCIYEQFLVMICETIYAIILSIILGPNLNKFLEISLGTLITNISISMILLILINIKITRTLYDKVIIFVEKISYKYLIILSFFLMSVANVLAMTIYFKLDFIVLLVFNVSMTLICCFIIIHSFKSENNYILVSDKYNVAINSLKDYEDMMTKYRVKNHENKNLLKTLRAMIINKEKNIPEYIDSMVEEQYNDDDELLKNVSVIPTGGLRAAIYSEILKIKNNGIKYDLNIDREVKTVNFIELDTNTVIEICKIVGVFIDNAIEEVNNMDEKYISISLYMNGDNLNIKISNPFVGNIDVNKIFVEGYTTKEKGHGYGLALVKSIVSENSLFDNKVEINNNIFSQVLSIKKNKKL